MLRPTLSTLGVLALLAAAPASAFTIQFDNTDFTVTPVFNSVTSFSFTIEVAGPIAAGVTRTMTGAEFYAQDSSLQCTIAPDADLSDGPSSSSPMAVHRLALFLLCCGGSAAKEPQRPSLTDPVTPGLAEIARKRKPASPSAHPEIRAPTHRSSLPPRSLRSFTRSNRRADSPPAPAAGVVRKFLESNLKYFPYWNFVLNLRRNKRTYQRARYSVHQPSEVFMTRLSFWVIAACLSLALLALPAPAAIIATDLTSFGADPVSLRITLDDESMPGFLTISGIVGDDPRGDIRGLFLDFDPELSGFDINSDVEDPDALITNRAFDTANLPGGVNVQGEIVNDGFDSDLAFAFGSPGIGFDDISSFTVKLAGLTASEIAGVAARVMSVGPEGEQARPGSDKLFAGINDFAPVPGPDPSAIPESASVLLLGAGLLALAGWKRRR